jgi:prepilin peptidase CpaA
MSAHLLILGTLLAVAAAADVAQRRVPNLVVAPLAVAGLAAQWSSGGVLAAADGLLAGSLVTVVLGIAWAKGALGGGDLKLAAAAAIWLGSRSVLPFLLFAGVAGIPVAFTARFAHRLELYRLATRVSAGGPPLAEADLPRETAPMAVAVVLGVLAVLWGRP